VISRRWCASPPRAVRNLVNKGSIYKCSPVLEGAGRERGRHTAEITGTYADPGGEPDAQALPRGDPSRKLKMYSRKTD